MTPICTPLIKELESPLLLMMPGMAIIDEVLNANPDVAARVWPINFLREKEFSLLILGFFVANTVKTYSIQKLKIEKHLVIENKSLLWL